MENVRPFRRVDKHGGPSEADQDGVAVRVELTWLFGEPETKACLVYVYGKLAAILTCVGNSLPDEGTSTWLVTRDYGGACGRTEAFPSLAAAREWFEQRLKTG